MFDTSRDILNMVLAVYAVVLTVVIVWAVYYLGRIFRDASRVASSVRLKLELVDNIYTWSTINWRKALATWG